MSGCHSFCDVIKNIYNSSERLYQFTLPLIFMIGALRLGYTWEQIAETLRVGVVRQLVKHNTHLSVTSSPFRIF